MISYREEGKRKLIHLSSLWMAAALAFPVFPRWGMTLFFAALLLGTLLTEHAYAKGVPFVRKIYGFCFGKMLRQEPSPDAWIVSGAAPVYAAAALAALLFSPRCGAAAMALMLTGDTAAALIGRKFGRHVVVNGKSLEGCLAFLLAGGAVVMLIYGRTGHWGYAVGAVVAAMLAELFEKQLRIDDNLSIVLTSGIFLTAGEIWS